MVVVKLKKNNAYRKNSFKGPEYLLTHTLSLQWKKKKDENQVSPGFICLTPISTNISSMSRSNPLMGLIISEANFLQLHLSLKNIKLPQSLFCDFSCLMVLIMCAKWMVWGMSIENSNIKWLLFSFKCVLIYELPFLSRYILNCPLIFCSQTLISTILMRYLAHCSCLGIVKYTFHQLPNTVSFISPYKQRHYAQNRSIYFDLQDFFGNR